MFVSCSFPKFHEGRDGRKNTWRDLHSYYLIEQAVQNTSQISQLITYYRIMQTFQNLNISWGKKLSSSEKHILVMVLRNLLLSPGLCYHENMWINCLIQGSLLLRGEIPTIWIEIQFKYVGKGGILIRNYYQRPLTWT